MAIIDSATVNKKVISQDAYEVGEVQDIRYDPATWNIEGLKLRCSKTVSSMISAGTSKSMIMLGPVQFSMNDVIVLPDDIEGANSYIRADSDNFSAVSYLMGRKVISADGATIGAVESVLIDLDDWSLNSLRVKLDKTAYERLGIKKGLIFGKTVSGLLVNLIEAVTENIMLNVTADELKDIVIQD